MKAFRQLFELWFNILGYVSLGLAMKCDRPECGRVVDRLNPQQYARWKARKTIACRSCGDGVLEDAAVW